VTNNADQRDRARGHHREPRPPRGFRHRLIPHVHEPRGRPLASEQGHALTLHGDARHVLARHRDRDIVCNTSAIPLFSFFASSKKATTTSEASSLPSTTHVAACDAKQVVIVREPWETNDASREGETPVRSMQPLSPREGEKELREVRRLHSREAA
tara:strand:- start:1377 stop:1844 length:468 start_codon:yes stop_codon:yes gene_type:complete